MHLKISFSTKDLGFFKRATSDSRARKNVQQWLPRRDAWKAWGNGEFLDLMAECICSTQQQVESKRFRDFKRKAVYGKRLWRKPKDKIEKVLRRYGVRFPKRKAEQIASNRNVDFVELMKKISKDHPAGNIDEERKARKTFLETVGKGFGPKQASHFLMYAGYSTRLVPVDSRWINALQRMGIGVQDLSELGYLIVEEVANKVATTLGIETTALDVAVWTVSGN